MAQNLLNRPLVNVKGFQFECWNDFIRFEFKSIPDASVFCFTIRMNFCFHSVYIRQQLRLSNKFIIMNFRCDSLAKSFHCLLYPELVTRADQLLRKKCSGNSLEMTLSSLLMLQFVWWGAARIKRMQINKISIFLRKIASFLPNFESIRCFLIKLPPISNKIFFLMCCCVR